MTRLGWPGYSAVAGFLTVGLAGIVAVQSHAPWLDRASGAREDVPAVVTLAPVTISAHAQVERSDAGYYDQIRRKVHWVQTRIGNDTLLTPDLESRMLLAKSAAQRAGLATVGLGFKDVYGIINAETSWIP